MFSRPFHALLAGGVLAALALAATLSGASSDRLSLISFLTRFVHIGAAMVWVGMIWFVNYVQLAALKDASPEERAGLLRLVVPRVAAIFAAASHVTLLSGVGMLLATGYMLDRWVFPSAVYIPSARAAMIWGGTLGALVMWGLVHRVIAPSLRIVLEGSEAPARVAAARARIQMAARANLALAVFVTFTMVAAAHFY